MRSDIGKHVIPAGKHTFCMHSNDADELSDNTGKLFDNNCKHIDDIIGKFFDTTISTALVIITASAAADARRRGEISVPSIYVAYGKFFDIGKHVSPAGKRTFGMHSNAADELFDNTGKLFDNNCKYFVDPICKFFETIGKLSDNTGKLFDNGKYIVDSMGKFFDTIGGSYCQDFAGSHTDGKHKV